MLKKKQCLVLFNSAFIRKISESGNNKRLARLKYLQEWYQKDDGLPVWMKSATDRLLFKITFLGCLCGLTMGLYTVIWELSIRKRFFNDSK
ncbi:unnamed protein product [Phyllotreta striolata]|uniref:Uncharacterized protein n=1 Tax=Phyllotreta striolata TaxID=444603 RepID=A0A9N9TBJ1_PHYSR|nr:unnamed protein product [Phyllotreta striolata]